MAVDIHSITNHKPAQIQFTVSQLCAVLLTYISDCNPRRNKTRPEIWVMVVLTTHVAEITDDADASYFLPLLLLVWLALMV